MISVWRFALPGSPHAAGFLSNFDQNDDVDDAKIDDVDILLSRGPNLMVYGSK